MPPEMEDMADAAGDAALEAYQTALDGGADPSEAAAAAIDAASTVMTDMGAPADMVDTMASAAQDGFDSALADGASPGDAFEAAGDSVDEAFGGEGDMGEGPDDMAMGPEGDMGPGPDEMGPPPEGDMGPGPG